MGLVPGDGNQAKSFKNYGMFRRIASENDLLMRRHKILMNFAYQ